MRVRLAFALVALPALYAGCQVTQTLDALDRVEAERDTWQRPDAVLQQLRVQPGATVVDLGSGAGYFTLKIAPRLYPGGRVLAVDLRRESLAFLWLRSRLRGLSNVDVIVGTAEDPRVPRISVDRVLIANTLHEMSAPAAVLDVIARAMRPGAVLVVLDRTPRETGGSRSEHGIEPEAGQRLVTAHGLEVVHRDDHFIDRPQDDDVWWLMVFRMR